MNSACPCGHRHITLRQGVIVVEMADFGPSKIWNADLRTCANGHEVLCGFGDHPMSEHYKDGFAFLLERLKKQRIEGVDIFYVE